MTRPPGGRVALALLFAVLALNAWAQVALVPFGRSDDPAALVALQTLIGATGAAAAGGRWPAARWAPGAALAYGLVTAGMLAVLPSLLGLPVEARAGIWAGAASVLAFGVWAAWYLRRAVRRAAADVASPPT